MKMKFIFFICFIMLSFSFLIDEVYAASDLRLTISSTKTINLSGIASGYWGQGATVSYDGNYIFLLFTNSSDVAKLYIYKKSGSTYNCVGKIDDLSCGHGNGATYYESGGKKYLLVNTNSTNPSVVKYELDLSNYKIKSTTKINITGSYAGIAYDKDKDVFYLSGTKSIYVWDTAFTTRRLLRAEGTGSASSGGTKGFLYANQDISYYDGHIYTVASLTDANCSTISTGYGYSSLCSRTSNDNIIGVFNTDTGDFSKLLYLHADNNPHYKELEDVLFIDGSLYGVFSSGNVIVAKATNSNIYTYNKLYIKYDMNGGKLASVHGSKYTSSGSTVLNDGSTTFTAGSAGALLGKDGLYDHNSPSYINIERAGYTAKAGAEWNTKANGSGTSYNQETRYKISDIADVSGGDKTVTMYVNWVANTYTIKFDGNGGSGSMSNISATYDTNKTLSKNTFTKSGYKFVKWNTKADGSGTSYNDEASVKNLTATNKGTVTLYAQWSAITSYITGVTNDLVLGKNDMLIGNVVKNADINGLVSKLTFNGTSQVFDKSGNEVTGRTTINGGDIIRITNGSDVSNYKVILRGDVNQDDEVNSNDVKYLAKYIINRNNSLTNDGKLIADINRDNSIKMNDVMILLNRYV